jgi:ATP-binding cassette subfamily C protein LapB
MAAAWRWLYPADTWEFLPAKQLLTAQLPALVQAQDAHGNGTWRILRDLPPPTSSAQEAPPDARAAIIHPAPAFGESAPEKSKRLATQAVWHALKVHARPFGVAGLGALIVNLLAVMSSLFSMQVYDRVVPTFAYTTLWALTIGVGLAIGLEWLMRVLRTFVVERTTRRMDEALSHFFLTRVMSARLDRRPRAIGTLVSQVRDYDSIKQFFTSTTLFALADMPFALLFITLMALIGGPIALVPLACLPIFIAVGLASHRPLARLQAQNMRESARRNGLLFEAIDGAENVKAFGAQWHFSRLWQDLNFKVGDSGEKIRRLTSATTLAANTVQQLAYVATVVTGVHLIERGDLTMGGVIACTILAGRALGNISALTTMMVQWHHAGEAMHVLNGLLAAEADDDPQRCVVNHSVAPQISAAELLYQYAPELAPALHIPKLELRAGERIALLGTNGSGKSTLLRLVAGVLTPNQGRVTLDGIDLAQADAIWLREQIGYLPQDVRLFAGTLRENLTMGLGLHGDQEILEAAAATGLLPTIKRHPRGLDMELTEGGRGLSGGQRQLVALTRLWLAQPKLYVLDEPATGLDRDGATTIMKWLLTPDPQRTVIFSTHQVQWLEAADRVLILDQGRISMDISGQQLKNMSLGQTLSPPATAAPAISRQGAAP